MAIVPNPPILTDVSCMALIPFFIKLKDDAASNSIGSGLGPDSIRNVMLETVQGIDILLNTNLEPAIDPSLLGLALNKEVKVQSLEEEAEIHSVAEPFEISKIRGIKNKRGAKSIADIEDSIINKVYKKSRRKGRRRKNFFHSIQNQYSGSKIVNSSLSDSDFHNRREALYKEA
ncbi:hypothetical protein REPUB_Repub09cG0078800 [Reevesia pubescens]